MNQTIEANLNNADCIKQFSNVGSTTYVNICNSAQHIVPWGSGDWLAFTIITIIALIFLTFFSFIVYDTVRYN
jgi:hypothetical protein